MDESLKTGQEHIRIMCKPLKKKNCLPKYRLHFIYLKHYECSFRTDYRNVHKVEIPQWCISHLERTNHKFSTILAANLFLTYQTQNVTDDSNYQSCQVSSRRRMCDHWERLMSLQFYKLMHRQKRWFTQWQKLWKCH